MPTTRTRLAAQDAIVEAIFDRADAEERKNAPRLADAIRTEGARIAKRWGVTDVPGLPATKTGG